MWDRSYIQFKHKPRPTWAPLLEFPAVRIQHKFKSENTLNKLIEISDYFVKETIESILI